MSRLSVAVTIVVSFSFCAHAIAASPVKVLGNAKTGRKLFIAQQCGSCHLMGAANQLDGSGVGPDLDHVTKTYTQIVTQITKGGHGMTGYKGALSTAQIEDLAAFVYTTSHPTAHA